MCVENESQSQVATATYGRINEWEQVHKKDMVQLISGGRRLMGKLEWFASLAPENEPNPVQVGAVKLYELLESGNRREKWKCTGELALCELQHMQGAVAWAQLDGSVATIKLMR